MNINNKYRKETDSQAQKINLWLTKGEKEQGINQKFGINI